jgi:preprotein translocase subunit SecY
MWESIRKIWTLRDLRKRILYAIFLLFIVRVIAHIPLPGIDTSELQNFFSNNQVLGLLDIFSGGSISRFSIALMGVGPYITASIIMQLLQVVVPSLDALQKEGEYGRHKINQYTRYLTVPLAIFQAYGMLAILKNQHAISGWTPFGLATMLITVSAGSLLLMWIGELISENGIGNGISLIISIGIIAGFPALFGRKLALVYTGGVIDFSQIFGLLAFLVLFIVTVTFIIYMTEGERQIPVAYARRIRGQRSYGGVETHLPLRVNSAGVIPIIFAISLMLFPGILGQFFGQAKSAWIAESAKYIAKLFNPGTVWYVSAYFVLVFLFTYFYTFVVFKPDQIAENLQKQGGFVPGIRPGQETSSYLSNVLNRITLAGAFFLGLVAILPFLVPFVTKDQNLVLGGTGILIVVSVIIETMRQVKAQLVMRTYDRY